MKDATSRADAINVIFLCTLDGRGAEFINLPTGRKSPDKAYVKYLKRVHKELTRPWAVLDCVVESFEAANKQTFLFLVDTALNIA